MIKKFKRGFGAKVMLFMTAIGFAFSMKVPAVQALLPDGFSVHVINVGKGDCSLITETYQDEITHEKKQVNILIDAGPLDAAGHVVEYLKGCGVEEIERIYVTHYHDDHYGGVPAILDNFRVKEIVLPVIPKGNIEAGEYCTLSNDRFAPFMNKVRAAEASAGLKIIEHVEHEIRTKRGECFGEDITIADVTPAIRTNPDLSLNDTSILLKVSSGFKSFLFLGDATEVELKDLLETNEKRKGFLQADFVKMPWHGHAHAFGLGERLLDTVQPMYAAISLGGDISEKLRQMAWYGGPGNKPTLDRLNAREMLTFTTDFRGGKDIVAQLASFGVTVGYAG